MEGRANTFFDQNTKIPQPSPPRKNVPSLSHSDGFSTYVQETTIYRQHFRLRSFASLRSTMSFYEYCQRCVSSWIHNLVLLLTWTALCLWAGRHTKQTELFFWVDFCPHSLPGQSRQGNNKTAKIHFHITHKISDRYIKNPRAQLKWKENFC